MLWHDIFLEIQGEVLLILLQSRNHSEANISKSIDSVGVYFDYLNEKTIVRGI